ncbi:MAG: DDE-type integrase/transposase/recombinase [Candidatus Bathyarchaeia archaeon]
MQSVTLSREVRGRTIAETPDQVKRLSDHSYHVRSQTGEGVYRVVSKKFKWSCECPDYEYRAVECKHIWAVRFSLALRKEVEAAQVQVIEPVRDIDACIFCHATEIVRDGLRNNKHGQIQKWNCKVCGRYFTVNQGFERMKHTPQIVTTAMQLYFGGQSLRTTANSLRLLGVNVTHKTVFMWIKKYTALMEKYLDRITPQVSDTWRADEIYVKMKGNANWLFALMDDETRFWLAREVASSKERHDAHNLLRNGARTAGKKPKLFITDGLAAYHDAYQREFWTQDRQTEHIQHISFASSGYHNNNAIERFNGELRDQKKSCVHSRLPRHR